MSLLSECRVFDDRTTQFNLGLRPSKIRHEVVLSVYVFKVKMGVIAVAPHFPLKGN